MVRLSNITTKTGDKGTSRLADGSELAKDHPLFHAIGSCDECNCTIGLALLEELPDDIKSQLQQIQNDLFDVGSDLASPPGVSWEPVRIDASYTERLERWTAEHGDFLQPLNSFTLPGGSRASAFLHQARSVARRAERWAVSAWPEMPQVEQREARWPVIYLNRLSDLLFQLTRRCNNDGATDVLWVKGAGKNT